MSILLTAEQVAFRNKALIDNLRYKYPQLDNYSDKSLIAAYDEWFLTADSTGSEDEDDFLEYINTD